MYTYIHIYIDTHMYIYTHKYTYDAGPGLPAPQSRPVVWYLCLFLLGFSASLFPPSL